ncbi:unnamed protein product, partial [Rotaria sp. Silwood2]
DIYLSDLAEKYNIKKDLVERLHILEDFEIVILCDDSGSMNSQIDGTEKTRWQELKEIVKIVLEVATVFDENGVNVYFIHRRPVFDVTDPKMVDQHFIEDPQGYGSLVPLLQVIFQLPASKVGNDKKLLVFIATDGSTTDETNEFALSPLEKVMREERVSDTTHVMFLLCNNDSKSIEYFSQWDENMKNVDVTRSYKTEKEIICRYRGRDYPFSFGDYVVKALLGAVDPDIDALNEPDVDCDNDAQ